MVMCEGQNRHQHIIYHAMFQVRTYVIMQPYRLSRSFKRVWNEAISCMGIHFWMHRQTNIGKHRHIEVVRATGKDDLQRLQTRRRPGYNMTEIATGKDDLLRLQTRWRLGYNTTEMATGNTEHWKHLASHSSHLFNNVLFKPRWRISMPIWLHWRSQKM